MEERLSFALVPSFTKSTSLTDAAVYVESDELELFWKLKPKNARSSRELLAAMVERGVVTQNKDSIVLQDQATLSALAFFEERLAERLLKNYATTEIITITETWNHLAIVFGDADPDAELMARQVHALLAKRRSTLQVEDHWGPGHNQKVTTISEGDESVTVSISITPFNPFIPFSPKPFP